MRQVSPLLAIAPSLSEPIHLPPRWVWWRGRVYVGRRVHLRAINSRFSRNKAARLWRWYTEKSFVLLKWLQKKIKNKHRTQPVTPISRVTHHWLVVRFEIDGQPLKEMIICERIRKRWILGSKVKLRTKYIWTVNDVRLLYTVRVPLQREVNISNGIFYLASYWWVTSFILGMQDVDLFYGWPNIVKSLRITSGLCTQMGKNSYNLLFHHQMFWMADFVLLWHH